MRLIRFTTRECDFIERVLEDLVTQELDETGQAASILNYMETTAGLMRFENMELNDD